MKSSKHNFLSFIFLFVFLTAFSSGIYASVSQSLFHYSKDKELKTDNTIPSEDFVFEETETETELELEHTAILLPYVISFLNYDRVFLPIISEEPSEEITCTPIYLAVCNFRI